MRSPQSPGCVIRMPLGDVLPCNFVRMISSGRQLASSGQHLKAGITFFDAYQMLAHDVGSWRESALVWSADNLYKAGDRKGACLRLDLLFKNWPYTRKAEGHKHTAYGCAATTTRATTPTTVSGATGNVVGSAVVGLPGGVWVDSNGDGRSDGFRYDGLFYQDVSPEAVSATYRTPVSPDNREDEVEQTRSTTRTSSSSRDLSNQTHCIEFERDANEIADFVVNNCPYSVAVLFRDESGNSGAAPVSASGRQSIFKLKGRVSAAACRQPAIPTFVGGDQGRCN